MPLRAHPLPFARDVAHSCTWQDLTFTELADHCLPVCTRTLRARVRAREEALKSKRRIDSSTATSQRDALLGPSRGSHRAAPTPTGSTSKDDELMNATANVTDGLRRTRQLLEQELERSSLSTQMLGELTYYADPLKIAEKHPVLMYTRPERSSQTLTLTSDQYTTFSGLLNASKSLITTMQKADTLDRLLILAALLFFGLVCLLIVKRRIIDRGIRAATLFSRIAGVGSSASIRSSLSSSASLLASTVTTREVTAKASPVVTITGPTLISHILTSANIASAAVATALSPSLPSALSSQAHWTTDTISSTTLEQQSASISTELTGQSHDSVRSAATANVETRMVDVGGDMHSYSEHVVDEL